MWEFKKKIKKCLVCSGRGSRGWLDFWIFIFFKKKREEKKNNSEIIKLKGIDAWNADIINF
jgi:hypothetical protein